MLTEDQIKAMAYKASAGETGRREFNADLAWLLAFARSVEAAERERCAKLCEDIGDEYQRREAFKWAEMKTDAQTGAHDCAERIRAGA